MGRVACSELKSTFSDSLSGVVVEHAEAIYRWVISLEVGNSHNTPISTLLLMVVWEHYWSVPKEGGREEGGREEEKDSGRRDDQVISSLTVTPFTRSMQSSVMPRTRAIFSTSMANH